MAVLLDRCRTNLLVVMEEGMKSFGRVALVWRVMFRSMCVVVRRERMGLGVLIFMRLI